MLSQSTGKIVVFAMLIVVDLPVILWYINRIQMKRILIAAIAGCVILFVWGAISHMVLLIGTGFTPLPDEDKVIASLGSSLPGKGLYFFPGKDFRHSSAAQESVFNEKFRTGPVGMLVYRPVGGDPFSLGKLMTQLVCCFITTLILAIVLSGLAAGFWWRVLVAGLTSCLACSSVSSIYWNWYEFPTSFFLAQCVDQIAGGLLAGLVIAKIVPRNVRDVLA